jgi:hypothetical protein
MTSWTPRSDDAGEPASPPRRRRTRSLLPFLGQAERDQALDDLALRAFPRLNFFLFTLVAGFLISLSIVFSSPVLLVAGLAFSPLLSPLTGAALGLVTASLRFAVRNLAALALAWILAFVAAWTAAFLFSFLPAERSIFPPLDLLTVLAVVLAAAGLTWRFLRGADDAVIPNWIVSYGCLYPLSAAAWLMAAGRGEEALIAWLAWGVCACLALLASVVAYLAFGFHPTERGISAYTGIAAAVAVGLALLLAWTGGTIPTTQKPEGTLAPILLPTDTPLPTQIPSITLTPPPPTGTWTPTRTPTPTPTPVSAVVRGTGGQGVFLRDGPGLTAKKIASLAEGEIVEVIGEPVEKDGTWWVQVRTSSGVTGWMALEFCATATPVRTP